LITEQRAELVRCLIASLADCSEFASGELTACPSPQQRAQFLINVKAHSMINSEDPTGAAENMSPFAIGIVDQDIEDGEQSEVRVVRVNQRDRTILAVKALHSGKPALLGYGGTGDKINKLVRGSFIDLDPDLKRPAPEGSVDKHCDRHAVEAADPGHLVRGNLAKSEGAVWEVPERPVALEACSSRPVICSSP
jgi:hypothetical protein